MGTKGWLRDLIEILDRAMTAEELLSKHAPRHVSGPHLRSTRRESCASAPKGRDTPVDFAWRAIHTDL